jgi:hypothetical protein
VKALAELVAGLATGSNLLGTYDAGAAGGGSIATVTAGASGGGRAGFAVAAKIAAGSGMKEGDYFLVTKAGTVTGETPATLNVAMNANDHIVYDGATWHLVSSGVVAGAAFAVHSAADVSDTTVASVTSANQKGVLVRDSGVAADGTAAAYKLVNVLDLGTF